ncbi:MAG: tRNA (adenosine(37)-N6)-dimethylallyltransferase MiaA, partial [Clostridiales bacterium]|nr:tRNA (adenosine(37)-N6)-dimethylallyltransferase MiaA [Clostridiales bacterium]
DIDFTEQDGDPAFREELERIADQEGAHALHERLRCADPASAEAIHENNVKRVIRALEFYEKSGEPISAHNERERQKESPYNFCYFVLNDDRERVYERIDRRVDRMLEDGLADEVKALRAKGYHRGMVSMQGLGYKEIMAWLDGETPYEEAIRVLKRDTRHFAKRQLTWFRREKNVIWIERSDFAGEKEILDEIMGKLRASGIL